MKCSCIHHLVGNRAILVGKWLLLWREPCRYVHRHYHQIAWLHISQVLLQPSEGGLVAIAHIEIFSPNVEVVVDDHIVHQPSIETVVVGAKVVLVGVMRRLVRTAVIVHIVVANDAIYGQIEPGNAFDILGKQPRAVAHDVTTIQPQYITVAQPSQGCLDVVEHRLILVQVAHRGHLRIGLDDERVMVVITRVACQPEVISHFIIDQPLIKCGNRRLIEGWLKTSWCGNINKSCLNWADECIATLLVGVHDVVAIGHSHARQWFVSARHQTRHRACGKPFFNAQCRMHNAE